MKNAELLCVKLGNLQEHEIKETWTIKNIALDGNGTARFKVKQQDNEYTICTLNTYQNQHSCDIPISNCKLVCESNSAAELHLIGTRTTSQEPPLEEKRKLEISVDATNKRNKYENFEVEEELADDTDESEDEIEEAETTPTFVPPAPKWKAVVTAKEAEAPEESDDDMAESDIEDIEEPEDESDSENSSDPEFSVPPPPPIPEKTQWGGKFGGKFSGKGRRKP